MTAFRILGTKTNLQSNQVNANEAMIPHTARLAIFLNRLISFSLAWDESWVAASDPDGESGVSPALSGFEGAGAGAGVWKKARGSST